MNNLWLKCKNGVNSLLKTGFFSVFLSSTLCKILSFLGGMVIVRLLSKSDYGEYTYIMNCYGMITILADLGCNSAALQFCNENHKDAVKSDAYFIYGYSKGMIFSLLTCVALLVAPFFYPFKSPEAAKMTQMLCLMPLLKTTYSFLAVNLRIRLKNGLYAKMNMFNSLITYVIILPAAYWLGVKGAVISEYIINALAILFSVVISRKYLHFNKNTNVISKKEKSFFLKLAVATQVNNGIDTALTLLDVFLIGIFITNTEVISSYKVAMTIPAALVFIPASLAIYIVPYFARNAGDIKWVKKNYYRLTAISGLANLFIVIGLIWISPFLIPLIFGKQYTDSIICFCILMVGYFFSATFRVPSANIIYTQKKVRANIVITVLSGIANCIFDVIFILNWGSVGAACATALVLVINSALSFGYMSLYIRKTEKSLDFE